jgi:hypothetical protein
MEKFSINISGREIDLLDKCWCGGYLIYHAFYEGDWL